MATFFGSPPFISHPVVRTQHLSSSPQPPPPPLPPSQPPSQRPPLGTSSEELRPPLPLASERGGKAKGTSADSTDWIASSLTRRFGLGAGLAWAGFLAFGVVSEQIKTRFEVTQQEANTRFVFIGTWMYQNASKYQLVLIILTKTLSFNRHLLYKNKNPSSFKPEYNGLFRMCSGAKRFVQLLQRCRDRRGGGVT